MQDSIQNDPDQKAKKSSLLVHKGDMKSAPKAKLKRGLIGGNTYLKKLIHNVINDNIMNNE